MKDNAKKLNDQADARFREMLEKGPSEDSQILFEDEGDYVNRVRRYLEYVAKNHKDCEDLDQSRMYVGEWLRKKARQGYTGLTIYSDESALDWFYDIPPLGKNQFAVGVREIRRAGVQRKPRKRLSTEVRNFAARTGLRKRELIQLRGRDLLSREQLADESAQLELAPEGERSELDDARLDMLKRMSAVPAEYFFSVGEDPGRIAPILGDEDEAVIRRVRDTKPDDPVFPHVTPLQDNGKCRRDYAARLYSTLVSGGGKPTADRETERDALQTCALALGVKEIRSVIRLLGNDKK